MAKVFTIAPGLDNLGAMKTGGQGSVYKGRRIGEIITAIKLLPTPIHSESANDKSFRDFTNEVEKLKRVNREPNPNVVKILSSGLSETGNFPYIEMDFIEGPDLEELLMPPHGPLFRISEVVKVATHLSNALAHCHKNEIKHGDIKSNNVKYNVHTGNYVLLDFGLAVMTDEERRTSLRQAGAIEFMAPEQNEGKLLFQTDIYGFGIILFELIAGKVPFPLQDKSESARNVTRLQHMETPVPDMLVIRTTNMPHQWSPEQKAKEMMVPKWLVHLVGKCLEKKPENRFANGKSLHDFIAHHSTHQMAIENVPVRNNNSDWQLNQYRQQLEMKDNEIISLKQVISSGVNLSTNTSNTLVRSSESQGVSKNAFLFVLLVAITLAAYTTYSFLTGGRQNLTQTTLDSSFTNPADTIASSFRRVDTLPKRTVEKKAPSIDSSSLDVTEPDPSLVDQTNSLGVSGAERTVGDKGLPIASPTVLSGVKYKVAVEKAYFYTIADEISKRKAYMVPSDNTLLNPVNEENGFIYIEFTNQYGQTSKGWLNKSDLKVVSE